MKQSDPTPPSCESPLPARLLLRLADLPKLFTRPTWQNVLLLVAGAILAPGKRTVTAVLRILMPRDSKVVRSATRRLAGRRVLGR